MDHATTRTRNLDARLFLLWVTGSLRGKTLSIMGILTVACLVFAGIGSPLAHGAFLLAILLPLATPALRRMPARIRLYGMGALRTPVWCQLDIEELAEIPLAHSPNDATRRVAPHLFTWADVVGTAKGAATWDRGRGGVRLLTDHGRLVSARFTHLYDRDLLAGIRAGSRVAVCGRVVALGKTPHSQVSTSPGTFDHGVEVTLDDCLVAPAPGGDPGHRASPGGARA